MTGIAPRILPSSRYALTTMLDRCRSFAPRSSLISQLVRRVSADLGLPADYAREALERLRAVTQHSGREPAALATLAMEALADAACEAGDHAAEVRIGREHLRGLGDPPGSGADPRDGWRSVLRGLRHLADVADEAHRADLLAVLSEAAEEASADIDRRLDEQGVPADARRRYVDEIADVLLRANRELHRPIPGPAVDLDRRRGARARRSATGPTFLARHAEGIAAIWARDGREWYRQRHIDRHGVAPPAGWCVDDSESPTGWRVAPEMTDLFDAEDRAAFFEEMESRYRAELGLPARGEGWVSQLALARCLEGALTGVEIVHEARAPWLAAQRLDLFVPSLGLAVEYQGEQHYLPLDHWGGEAGLAARRELDERKRDACLRAGVILLEWRYDEPIGIDAVRVRLERAGFGDLD